MSNHTELIQHLATTVAPLLLHNFTSEPHPGAPQHGNHTITEGGFLSGRNPFIFIATAPLPTFIVQVSD